MSLCEHMKSVPVPEPKAATGGCEECLKIGQEWVHRVFPAGLRE